MAIQFSKSLTAAGTVNIDLTTTPEQENVAIVQVSGTFTVAVGTFQGSPDGTNYSNLAAYRMDNAQLETTPTLTDATTRVWKVDITGMKNFQFNLTAIASLTITTQINALFIPGGVNYLVQASSNPLSVTNLNLTVGASTAAAGTTHSDAAALPAGTASSYPTTGATDATGVILNVADQVTGRMLYIGNGVSNKILKIYPPSGGTINGGSADAAFSTGSGKSAWIECLSGAGNTWLAVG